MKKYLHKLNMFERILFCIFRRYTNKIYNKGFQDGYNERNMGDECFPLSSHSSIKLTKNE